MKALTKSKCAFALYPAKRDAIYTFYFKLFASKNLLIFLAHFLNSFFVGIAIRLPAAVLLKSYVIKLIIITIKYGFRLRFAIKNFQKNRKSIKVEMNLRLRRCKKENKNWCTETIIGSIYLIYRKKKNVFITNPFNNHGCNYHVSMLKIKSEFF